MNLFLWQVREIGREAGVKGKERICHVRQNLTLVWWALGFGGILKFYMLKDDSPGQLGGSVG